MVSRQSDCAQTSPARRLDRRGLAELIGIEFRRSPALHRACLRLWALADDAGVVELRGGVRGWARTLDCSASYPRELFAQLEARDLARVDVAQGPRRKGQARGGMVATVYFLVAPDRSVIESPDTEGQASDRAPRPNAERSIADRIPQTPYMEETHEEQQKQQKAAAPPAEAELVGPAAPGPGQAGQLLDLGQALDRFKGADPALVRLLWSHADVDAGAAGRALEGRPRATLAEWRADLAAAEAARRRGIEWPIGLVLKEWARGRRVAPPAAPVARPAEGAAPSSAGPPSSRAAPSSARSSSSWPAAVKPTAESQAADQAFMAAIARVTGSTAPGGPRVARAAELLARGLAEDEARAQLELDDQAYAARMRGEAPPPALEAPAPPARPRAGPPGERVPNPLERVPPPARGSKLTPRQRAAARAAAAGAD